MYYFWIIRKGVNIKMQKKAMACIRMDVFMVIGSVFGLLQQLHVSFAAG
jgi:hypothetical protein